MNINNAIADPLFDFPCPFTYIHTHTHDPQTFYIHLSKTLPLLFSFFGFSIHLISSRMLHERNRFFASYFVRAYIYFRFDFGFDFIFFCPSIPNDKLSQEIRLLLPTPFTFIGIVIRFYFSRIFWVFFFIHSSFFIFQFFSFNSIARHCWSFNFFSS